MDMRLGHLEKRIRVLHNEYTAKIRERKLDPITEQYFLNEVWQITRFHLDEVEYPLEKAADALGPTMDSLMKMGCSFNDACKLAHELRFQVSIIKKLYHDKGLEGNDLEFITRYAGAAGVVGYVCGYFKFYHDSHDASRIQEQKRLDEWVSENQERTRKEVKKFLNIQTVKFGLFVFVCIWIFMGNRYEGWKSAVLALCICLPSSFLIGFGVRYSEGLEKAEEKVDYFWNIALSMLILFIVLLIIRSPRFLIDGI